MKKTATTIENVVPTTFTRTLHNGTVVTGQAFHEMEFNSKVQNYLMHHVGIPQRIALYMVLIGTNVLEHYFDPKDDKKQVVGDRSGFKTESEAIALCREGFEKISDIAKIEIA